MVYSARLFVLCLTLCHFILAFFSPFSIAITSLGVERANLSAFRTFVRFVLVWICRFPLPLGVWEGLRFVIVALPGLFSYFILAFLSVNSVFTKYKKIENSVESYVAMWMTSCMQETLFWKTYGKLRARFSAEEKTFNYIGFKVQQHSYKVILDHSYYIVHIILSEPSRKKVDSKI